VYKSSKNTPFLTYMAKGDIHSDLGYPTANFLSPSRYITSLILKAIILLFKMRGIKPRLQKLHKEKVMSVN